jgi:hypothetical protein
MPTSSKESHQSSPDGTYPQNNTQRNTTCNSPNGTYPHPLKDGYELGYDSPVTVSRKETIRELKRELAAVHRKGNQIASAIRALEVLEGVSATEAEGKTKPAASSRSYPDITFSALEKFTRPQGVRAIIEALDKSGYPVATAKPYRTIYKVLKSHPELFVNVGGKWRVKTDQDRGIR